MRTVNERRRSVMRIVAFLIVSALVATSAWARLGETAAQAAKRYGPGSESRSFPGVTDYPADKVQVRMYTNGVITVYAIFFPNKSGESVIGLMMFDFPSADAQAAARPAILEANSAGEKWEGSQWTAYSRPGATAYVANMPYDDKLVLRLNEFTEFCKGIEAKGKQEEIDKTKKSVQGF